MAKRRSSPRRQATKGRPPEAERRPDLGFRVDLIPLYLLVLVTPWVVDPEALDSFRLPKLIVAETLALPSLGALALRLRTVEALSWKSLAGIPAVRALFPVLIAAALGFLTSDHLGHVGRAYPSLLIAVAAVIGWSIALRHRERRQLFLLMLAPAFVLSALGILQYFGIATPFDFGDISRRLAVTSRAGGAYDLAAYLLLPVLVTQVGWKLAKKPWQRYVFAGLLAVFVFAIVVTQTLTAIFALVLMSVIFWLPLLARRDWLRTMAAGITVLIVMVLAFAPLRDRLATKITNVERGQVNDFFTGRLDGWRAAWWMFTEHPIVGVGHGAYRAEYGRARLVLYADGVEFYQKQHQTFFVNAHSDPLEALAEWGLVGAIAMLWGVWWIGRSLRRRYGELRQRDPAVAAFLPAALAALVVLACTGFPLHLALIAYPFLLVLSEVLAPADEEVEA
ncbi:MAG: O-antigen ligase family protein [Acidobacteriota bacterium]